MKVVAKRFRVLGILALVAVLAFLFVPKAVQAAPEATIAPTLLQVLVNQYGLLSPRPLDL